MQNKRREVQPIHGDHECLASWTSTSLHNKGRGRKFNHRVDIEDSVFLAKKLGNLESRVI